jgi:aspartate/methionine/tyrosine aminotransferase
MKSLSQVTAKIDGQPMFKYLDMAKSLEVKGQHLIHMEIGEPDFDTPKNVTWAAVQSLSNGETHYGSSFGLQEFREAVQFATERSRGFRPDLDQVLITPGANIAIYYAVFCLVDPGFEVIVPDPGFSTYYSNIKMCGAVPVRVPLKEENEFRMNPDDIEAAITDKTRLIIINSPQNPTGSVLTTDEVKRIYEIAKKYDIYIYSDEIYARMNYEPIGFASPSIYDHCKEHVILSNGFSKAFAMTGWRLGTLIGPANVIERMAALLQTTSSCVSTFVQRAGIEAIRGSQETVTNMMAEYQARRDLLVDGLNRVKGIRCLRPGGAFYVFPNITGTGLSSDQVVEKLMDAGVVTLPGHCFGEHGKGYIRLCYATSRKNIQEGLNRIYKALGTK